MINLINNPALSSYRVILQKRITGVQYILLDNNSPISMVENFVIEEDADTPVIEVMMPVKQLSVNTVIELGDYISISVPYVKLDGSVSNNIKGNYMVMNTSYSGDLGSIILTLRNIAHFAMSNKLTLKIEEGDTATSFIYRTATQYGIPIHHIDSTTYRMKANLLENISLYDAWLNVITKAMIEENKNYRIRFTHIGLRVDELIIESQFWWFEVTQDYHNIINANRTHSIIDKDFVNVARGYVPPDQSEDILGLLSTTGTGLEITNNDSIAKYGTAYQDVDISKFSSEKEARDHLTQMVKKGNAIDHVEFTIFALNSLLPLDRIYVDCPPINASGKYFIKHITTSIKSNNFRQTIMATKLRDISKDVSQLIRQDKDEFVFGGIAL